MTTEVVEAAITGAATTAAAKKRLSFMISSVGKLIEVLEVKVGGNESVCQIEKILG